jgi:hypothetical protein
MGFIRVVKSIINSIVKLSRPIFNHEDNILKFKINSDLFYTYKLEDFEIKMQHDSYIIDAYTLKSKDLFIEYVQTDNDTAWNGLASSFYIDLIKQKLKVKSMEILEKHEFKNYDFITFKIDNHFILNFIYIYEINKDIFIIDISSSLYIKLISNFIKNYKYNFKKNEPDTLAFNFSIVRENYINNYFSYDGSQS